MKQIWQDFPIAYKIFGLVLLFLATVEIIAILFVWQFESKVLLKKEQQNLQRELNSHYNTLVTHFARLQKETDFLAKLEVMDDIIAKDIDKRILTLLERKAMDLGEDTILLIANKQGEIIIAPKAFLGLPIQAFSANYLYFQAPVFASFNIENKLGNLFLLYPLGNLQHLKTNNPSKRIWLQPPEKIPNFATPKISDDIIALRQLSRFLPRWKLVLSYKKEEALRTLKNIEQIQLYTFLISTLLLAVIIFFLSKKLTLPLIELLKSSEKALEAKTTFLSTISHELRTPLGSILNLTQHLTLSPKMDKESRKMLGGIETSAQHLLSMINNILQLSKLEAKNIIVQKEQVNLEEIMEEIFEITEPLVLDKEIDFIKRVSIDKKLFLTDSNLCKQIILNLLSNAIKFTERGKIEVSLLQRDKRYIFKVKDSGIGIEESRQEQLFTPFFQAHTDLTSLKNSSGLGLALSQKVAKLLGGRITIYSRGINKGTIATFYFKSL